MSMSLYLDGNQIGAFNPSDPHWWITTFNPSHQNITSDRISATFTVNFSGSVSKFSSFRNTETIAVSGFWTFDTQNNTAILRF